MKLSTKAALTLIILITGTLLLFALPGHTKTAPCCSCCTEADCQCSCKEKDSPHKTFYNSGNSPKKRTCDFNGCNGTIPCNAKRTLLLTTNTTTPKKKLLTAPQQHAVTEINYSYRKTSISPIYARHLLPPPPSVFLLTSCFRL